MAIQPTNRQSYNVQSASPFGIPMIVGTVSGEVAAADCGRRGIIFSNPGSQVISLLPGNQPVIAGQGIPLLPGATMRFIGDGKLLNYTCAWHAIAASGNDNPLQIIDITATVSIILIPAPGWSIDG